MSRISSAKTARIEKPFVDLPSIKLYISVKANALNQITGFHCRYNGSEFDSPVTSNDIEKAWKLVEQFIAKHNRR